MIINQIPKNLKKMVIILDKLYKTVSANDIEGFQLTNYFVEKTDNSDNLIEKWVNEDEIGIEICGKFVISIRGRIYICLCRIVTLTDEENGEKVDNTYIAEDEYENLF